MENERNNLELPWSFVSRLDPSKEAFRVAAAFCF
jgi:hypothetical protein